MMSAPTGGVRASGANVAVERQRFCPVCDRLFNEGEAVLRCAACQMQHHPACWVRNNGCATDTPHNASPQPEAYGVTAPRPVAVAAEPVAARPPRPSPAVVVPEKAAIAPASAEEFVIGRSAPARTTTREPDPPAPVLENRPRAKAGRYPDLSSANKVKPMPSIYPGHRYLRFWYVPIAAALAVVIAMGVIVASDRIFGDDGDKASAAADDTPTATVEGNTTPSSGAGASTTPVSQVTIVATPGSDLTPLPAGELGAGAEAVVTGTGECLNVRSGAGLANDPIACVPDGTAVTILGGPTASDGLNWWQVETPQGSGWAAADYLSAE